MKTSVQSVFILCAFIACASLTGCGQGLKDVSNSDELSIRFRFPATKGKVKNYLTDLKDVPNAPPLPGIYSPVPNRTYLISSEIVDLGDPVLTFKVPVPTEEEFARLRILRLIQDDLDPSGYRWRDCTLLREPPAERFSPELLKENPDYYSRYLEEVKDLLPNFPARTLACRDDNRWLAKEYVMVVEQSAAPPDRPFTSITMRLEPSDGIRKGGDIAYRLLIENSGSKDAAEINLWSIFGTDVSLISIVPSQGSCRARGRGISGEVCHLGKLPARATATIDFLGRPSGAPNGEPFPTGPINKHWKIEGYAKEKAGDPNWLVNRFEFLPLKSKSAPN